MHDFKIKSCEQLKNSLEVLIIEMISMQHVEWKIQGQKVSDGFLLFLSEKIRDRVSTMITKPPS